MNVMAWLFITIFASFSVLAVIGQSNGLSNDGFNGGTRRKYLLYNI